MVRKYLSYKDDDDITIVKGFFEIIEETANYIKFKTNSGKIIKLPYNRILKLKGDEE
jgi:hypothetical protein